jgi:hypothetical protein
MYTHPCTCRAFDFEGSAAWQAHLCHSIELPASASANAAALLRVKAKWFKKAVVSSSAAWQGRAHPSSTVARTQHAPTPACYQTCPLPLPSGS